MLTSQNRTKVHILQHFANGEYFSSEKQLETLNPWTGEHFASVPIGTLKDVGRSVDAARNALSGWRTLPVEKRAYFVKKMAEWLVAEYGNEGELTELKARIRDEVGKPLAEADIEVIESADFLFYFSGIAKDTLASQKPELDQNLWATKKSEVWFEPHGVVAIIKPWNYPLEMIAWSIGPALLAGNTVVVKPSEKSSVVASVFSKMAEDIGLPKGVVNVVLGDASTGAVLVEHDGVDYVSFTGSTNAGQQIAMECAKQIKPCSLELGGNDSAIVLEDADPELTANGLVWGAFCNAGQVCVGIKRAFVHEAKYDRIVELVQQKTRDLILGKDIGPIVDRKQLDTISDFVADAKLQGATILEGGAEIEIKGGHYFQPTVLVDVPKDARLIQEECFGPLLPIWKFSSIDEVIAGEAAYEFALGASIWTNDEKRARPIARRLPSGMVWVNDVNVALPQGPWGGNKRSGLGFELTPDSIKNYSRRRHYNYETSSDQKRVWWYPYGPEVENGE